MNPSAKVQVLLQRPNHIKVKVVADTTTVITLAQNKYPGWKVQVNNHELSSIHSFDLRTLINDRNLPEGISVQVGSGESTIDFIYDRKEQKYFAIILHILILSWMGWKLISTVKKINQSSSLS